MRRSVACLALLAACPIAARSRQAIDSARVGSSEVGARLSGPMLGLDLSF